MLVSPHFAGSYLQARGKFLDAARSCNAQLRSDTHPTALGAEGEALVIDTARLASDAAACLLIVSSGTHGVEGFAGSGCQVALMHDADLLARLRCAGVTLLLIHAVNPYGFSHRRRGNEDNVDLNRNFLRFDRPLQDNPGYAALHDLLLPDAWPPTDDNWAALSKHEALRGERAFRQAVMQGQHTHRDGLFHSGTRPAWSNRVVRQVVRDAGARSERVAWIDIHTGLGPCGHGEKIFGGDSDDELARARRWFGADLMSPQAAESASEQVRGPLIHCAGEECSRAQCTTLALEFGTVPHVQLMDALRAEQWLHNGAGHGTPEQCQRIRRAFLDAFYVDSDEWRAMLVAQARVAALQAGAGLAH